MAGDSICERCKALNKVWHTPSPIWNQVMKKGDGEELYSVVCMECFVYLAELSGIVPTSWCLTIHTKERGRIKATFEGNGFDWDNCLWRDE